MASKSSVVRPTATPPKRRAASTRQAIDKVGPGSAAAPLEASAKKTDHRVDTGPPPSSPCVEIENAAPADETERTQSTLRRIDAKVICHSRWANRIAEAPGSREFQELKESIERAGGNVQPIKVRLLQVSAEGTRRATNQFEIVFGHRRHRACLELGIPVNAIVAAMNDEQLFAEMDRENRAHRALSPFEQGLMFKHALDEGLFSSVRRLAQELAIDVSMVSKSIGIANLPTAVHQAFASPNDIQYRWARPLKTACTIAPQRTMDTADRLKTQNSAATVTPARIFKLLVGEPSIQVGDGASMQVCGKRARASFKVDRRGRLAIWFDRRLSDGLVKKLQVSLEKLLSE